ncbi:MAG: hypothetical protein V4732_06655 [Pseudomonadota bacterium]
MKIKIFIGVIVGFFLIAAINSFGSNKSFCADGKYKLGGSACWLINYYAKPRLQIQSRGSDFKSYVADFRIPFFLLGKPKYGTYGPHSIISLELKIVPNNKHFSKKYFETTLVFDLLKSELVNGLVASAENFKNTEQYKMIKETDTFKLYQHSRFAHGFTYYVPIIQPQRNLFIDCMRVCNLHSSYKNISYNAFIPIEWVNDYSKLQTLIELFLDSVIVEN